MEFSAIELGASHPGEGPFLPRSRTPYPHSSDLPQAAVDAPLGADRTGVRYASPGDAQTPAAAPRGWRKALKTGALTLLAIGGGAGASEGIRALAGVRKTSPPAPAHAAYFQDGNIFVAKELAQTYPAAVHYFEQAPAAKQTQDVLRNARPFLDNAPLSVVRGVASAYDPITNTIHMNDDTKYLVPTGPDYGDVGGVSAAGFLGHEFKHAQHAHDNLAALLVRAAIPDPQYDNLEEMLAIQEVNRDNAFLTNEANRTDHHNAPGAPAASVTDASLSGFTGDALAEINITERLYAADTPATFSNMQILQGLQNVAIFQQAIFLPSSFNLSVLERTASLIQEGNALSRQYSASIDGRTPDPTIAAEVDAFRQKALAFADAVSYVPEPQPHARLPWLLQYPLTCA